MFVPVTSRTPVVSTLARSTCDAAVIVRLLKSVVAPTASLNVTLPVSASNARLCAPSMVLLKLIFPSVLSSFASLSILTSAPRATGPLNAMLPSSLS